MQKDTLMSATASIASAYLGKTSGIKIDQLPDLIRVVSDSLRSVTSVPVVEAGPPAEVVTCRECGFQAKLLKRHIQTAHGMTPEQYVIKHGLSSEAELIAPAYAVFRSQQAVRFGLGKRRPFCVEAAD